MRVEGVIAVGAYQEGIPRGKGPHIYLWSICLPVSGLQLSISPSPVGSSGEGVMLASSALDAELLLGAPESCPVREGVSQVHGQLWEQCLGGLPYTPCL